MFKKIIWIAFLLLALDIVMFEGLALAMVSDEKVLPIAHFLYWVLKHVLSLPISIFNEDYPFFLDKGGMSILIALLFAAINDLIIASCIVATLWFVKNNRDTVKKKKDKTTF